MRGRRTAALTGSPVLVGSITLLVTIVAVFIAYNANAGLPFVPTYDVRVELPNASKLVVGNDVRAGGFRVGAVDEIRGGRSVVDGEEPAAAATNDALVANAASAASAVDGADRRDELLLDYLIGP